MISSQAQADPTEPSILQEALDASGLGLWTWELATGAVTWSAECYRIHGMHPGEFALTAPAFFALVHPADREAMETTVRTALEQHTQYACEFRVLRPGGEVGWVAGRGRGRYDAAGRPVGMIGTLADISASKRTEQAMQAALEASGAGTFHWTCAATRCAGTPRWTGCSGCARARSCSPSRSSSRWCIRTTAPA